MVNESVYRTLMTVTGKYRCFGSAALIQNGSGPSSDIHFIHAYTQINRSGYGEPVFGFNA
jgi:hypothetical protein